MRSDTDTRVAACHAMREEVALLWNELSTQTAWVRPEILAMESDRLRGFLDAEPSLRTHRHMLENLLRQRDHVLDPPRERILAEAGLITGGAHTLYNVLHNAELPWPDVELSTGERVVIIDDLMATGGTIGAAVNLVEKLGGDIVECAFVVELPDLNGREKLGNRKVFSIVEFEGE